MAPAPFRTARFDPLGGPVLLSVPHGGRDYDAALVKALRVPLASVRPLEDRFVDRLTDSAVAAGVPVIIADAPRLAIDLNRAPDDLDPESVRGWFQRNVPASAKARAGLGLIPTRLWGVGPLWRKGFDDATVAARVRDIHAPYHAAIERALRAAKQRWGVAVLIDLHSMPPVNSDDAPDIIIGDRFGCSAGPQITATVEAALTGMGFRVAVNTPYAGGYVVTRHAAQSANIHALQIEIDRRLYLDAAFDQPGPGLARMQRVVAQLVESLTEELSGRFAAAAE